MAERHVDWRRVVPPLDAGMRFVEPGDEDELRGLLAAVIPGADRSLLDRKFWWRNGDLSAVVAIDDDTGRIGAVMAVRPHRLRHPTGEVVDSFNVGDWYISPPMRGKHLGSRLKHWADHDWQSRASVGLSAAAGRSNIASGRGSINNGPMMIPLHLLRATSPWRSRATPGIDTAARWIDSDSELDEVDEVYADGSWPQVTMVRDAAELRYRLRSTDHRRHRLVTVTRGGRPVGYAVWRTSPPGYPLPQPLRLGLVSEIIVVEGTERAAVQALVDRVASDASACGRHGLLTFSTQPSVGAVLCERSMVSGERGWGRALARVGASQGLDARLHVTANYRLRAGGSPGWLLTPADADFDLSFGTTYEAAPLRPPVGGWPAAWRRGSRMLRR